MLTEQNMFEFRLQSSIPALYLTTQPRQIPGPFLRQTHHRTHHQIQPPGAPGAFQERPPERDTLYPCHKRMQATRNTLAPGFDPPWPRPNSTPVPEPKKPRTPERTHAHPDACGGDVGDPSPSCVRVCVCAELGVR